MFYIFGEVIFKISLKIIESLFLVHNKVNKRLRGEEVSNDPAWPKVQFPTKEQCSACVLRVDENNEVIEYDENETYNYLRNFYNMQNLSIQNVVSTKSNSAMKWQFNHLYLLVLLFLFKFVVNI